MTIFDHTTDLRGLAGTDAVWLVHIVRRGWQALLRWQDEHTAAAQLSALSDRELRDIGLSRGDIEFAVRGELPRQPHSKS